MALEIGPELGILPVVDGPGAAAAERLTDAGLAALPVPAPGERAWPSGVVGLARSIEAVWRAATGADLDVLALAAARAGVMPRPPAPQLRCPVSWGGSTVLAPTADGVGVALCLARAQDWASLGALTRSDRDLGDWPAVVDEVARHDAADLVEQGVLLGMAIARPGETATSRVGPAMVVRRGSPGPGRPLSGLRVVDLSALWAGPLCARLLGGLGATVVKVEDPRRPDGARLGDARWYHQLHSGQLAVTAELGNQAGRPRLQAVLSWADVVIEGSRPRALAQHGIDAADWVERGVIWVSITGHGRREQGHRIGFGDDAAVAGGLVSAAGDGTMGFAGDALADPLTGALAAASVAAAATQGGGWMLELALAHTAACAADPDWGPPIHVSAGLRPPNRPASMPDAPAPGLGAHDHLFDSSFFRRRE